MSVLFQRIDSLLVDYTTYDSADMLFDIMGFGKAPDEPVPMADAASKIAIHGEDETDQGCLGAAMHAVHAIAPVCAAAPGILTLLDLPMITGRGILARA